MRRLLLSLTLFVLTACGLRAPISHSVTIEPADDARTTTVTVRTDISEEPRNRAVAERQDEARRAILDDRDEWSVRLRAGRPESERVVFEKTRGVLRRADRTAVIRSEELQRVFADVGLTIQLSNLEGTSELAIYPAASTRATREQRDHVETALATWSRDAAEYFRAVDRLYSYLRSEPHRKEAAFTLLFASGDERSVIEEEDVMLNDVVRAMDRMLTHIDEAERDAVPLDEEFDLVYNPFPAEITVRVPGSILAAEGFERSGESLVIRRAGLLDVIESLEGRWISPDPLALLIRADTERKDLPAPKELAAMPLQSTSVVTPREIEDAVLSQVRPAAAYRVRWTE